MTSIWLARDKDGSLRGYIGDKPQRLYDELFITSYGDSDCFSLYDYLFPEITWENSPVEFIENKEEQHDDK